MKIFDGFNQEGKCIICGTNENKPCVLIPIEGTEEGFKVKAEAIHVDCIDLSLSLPHVAHDKCVIYQIIDVKFSYAGNKSKI